MANPFSLKRIGRLSMPIKFIILSRAVVAVFYEKKMMKKTRAIAWVVLLACMFLVGEITGQSKREVVKIRPQYFHPFMGGKSESLTSNLPIKLYPKSGPFLAVSIVWYSESWDEEKDYLAAHFLLDSIYYKKVGFYSDSHADKLKGRFVSKMYLLEGDISEFRLLKNGSSQIDSL